MVKEDIRISGDFKIENWLSLKEKLISNIHSDKWDDAIEIFENRVNSRFMNPIDAILKIDERKGEGFAAAALQSLLIEYLESFYQGKNYKENSNTSITNCDDIYTYCLKSTHTVEKIIHPFIYTSSAKLIKDFLRVREPFRKEFKKNAADLYYKHIRCGLLHEAATKGNSLILRLDGDIIMQKIENGIIIDPVNFQKALRLFINDYKIELLKTDELKWAFIRKMDGLCQVDKVDLFVYGSLLDENEMKNTVKVYNGIGPAFLKDFELVFNKISKDGSSKANLKVKKGSKVWGFCYQVDKCESLDKGYNYLIKREDGYDIKPILAYTDENIFYDAKVFISEETNDSLNPKREYVEQIIKGAKNKSLPEDYINNLIALLRTL